jgi:crotonobetainyl-CoA:carnitine CoA-transferase CaiB-like acyl-CoA transferase
MPSNGGVLAGIRVLDFGKHVAGPWCAALLADLGAEVIRIERPGGGDDRFIAPVAEDGSGAMYMICNRGKRAITLATHRAEATSGPPMWSLQTCPPPRGIGWASTGRVCTPGTRVWCW